MKDVRGGQEFPFKETTTTDQLHEIKQLYCSFLHTKVTQYFW